MEGPAIADDRQQERQEGCYCKIGDDFVGVFESKEGPKLFFNREIYKLSEDCWDVEIVVGKKQQLFTFYWKGEAIRSLRFSGHAGDVLKLYHMLPHRGGRAGAL